MQDKQYAVYFMLETFIRASANIFSSNRAPIANYTGLQAARTANQAAISKRQPFQEHTVE